MDITIYPQKLQGVLQAIPSKSQAHRLLICAALSDAPTKLHCKHTNDDIAATADCLNALGACIQRTSDGYEVAPIREVAKTALLNCRESGSTLRFMLPIAGAFGVDAEFLLSGRLPQRPLCPLWEEMERMGCRLTRPAPNKIRCTGRLSSGSYHISGSVSSQYITGLLFALSLIPGACFLHISGKIESAPYISMTQAALREFGVNAQFPEIPYAYPFHSPGTLSVEGDWSNGAFFLAAGALGSHVTLLGLKEDSYQGDREAANILPQLENRLTVDASDIPDLVPILAVVAGAKQGAVFKNIQRLRLKESDRVATVSQMLNGLGAATEVTEDTLTVHPGQYHGCTIDAAGDHRIAMAAAMAATVCDGPVTILGAQCVSKSYPSFWQEYRRLGGSYEQHLR